MQCPFFVQYSFEKMSRVYGITAVLLGKRIPFIGIKGINKSHQ
jgi:hypothetical protein